MGAKRTMTTVYVSREQERLLTHLSRATGRSKAYHIRVGLELVLAGSPPARRLRLVNQGRQSKTSVYLSREQQLTRLSHITGRSKAHHIRAGIELELERKRHLIPEQLGLHDEG